MTNKLTVSVFLFCLIYFCHTKVVDFDACESKCTINEVRVIPCKSTRNGPCQVKRGKSAEIQFDFTPDFDATTATGQVYAVYPDYDAPLPDMDTDACNFTKCPITKGTRQTYTYSLHLGSKYPTGPYTIKWIVSNSAEGKSTERCCFTTNVKLTSIA